MHMLFKWSGSCYLYLGHLRVGELQPLSPMNSTRLWCLVQAMTRHICPDPDLGSWNCLAHKIHIALGRSMSSIDQWVRFSARSRPFPAFITALISLRAFDLVSSPVWWEAATNKFLQCLSSNELELIYLLWVKQFQALHKSCTWLNRGYPTLTGTTTSCGLGNQWYPNRY